MAHTLSPASRETAFRTSSRDIVDCCSAATLLSATFRSAFALTTSDLSLLSSVACVGGKRHMLHIGIFSATSVNRRVDTGR